MCGIAGYTQRGGVGLDETLIRRMAGALTARGPDADGFLLDGPVALGHRRLKIIDLEGGAQPLANEDGSVWTVFNGEIYNFAALRAELAARGHRFTTRSDTEAIVHAYEEWGEACFRRFNGMFALAIWDRRRERLVLARDRIGKKPLYYAAVAGELVFGSELKALEQHPSIDTGVDLQALTRYLAFEFVPAPYSIYRGARKLPASHYLVWERGAAAVRSYWDLEFAENRYPSLEAAAEELRARLREAVRLRLVSDVPLGVLLSGGVDSSSVAALAAAAQPGLKTFSIGFAEPSFDESDYARRVAAHVGSEHHEERFSAATMRDLIPEVFGYLDEPLADGSVLPTYLLSRHARRWVTVALGGDGGDELFLGYPTFSAALLAEKYLRLPGWVRSAVAAGVARLPVSERNLSLDFRARLFLKGLEYPPPVRNQVWLGAFSREEQPALLTGAARAALREEDPYTELVSDVGGCRARDPVDRLSYQYLRYYLAEDILTKVDRASMANSLEVRAPLLDPAVVDLATHVPAAWKLGDGGKRILKRAVAPLLPSAILRRPKKGFGIPLTAWLRRDLRPLCDDLLGRSALEADGFFEPEVVARLLAEHRSGARDHRKPLWALLAFQLWRQRARTGGLPGMGTGAAQGSDSSQTSRSSPAR
jgi:asparagine synthase (glutamine-hydrolysing)